MISVKTLGTAGHNRWGQGGGDAAEHIQNPPFAATAKQQVKIENSHIFLQANQPELIC